MASLAGKVDIVTGSSRGIGRAIAERLGRDGVSVVMAYVR
jgi:3-oxoacyl-[acyl-carrier protein] reductase